MNDRDLVLSQIRQRLEILYQMVEELETGGGGEPGTTNYNDLSNKPSINGHTLIGAKTSSDLGLQPTISDLETIRSGAALGATAVQPATMNAALADKQDTLTFDTIPTNGSSNPITSGGVYTSLTTKVDKVNGKGLSTNDFTDEDKEQISANKAGIGAVANRGSKNLLKIAATTQTVNGITFTVNADDTITINGTATAAATLTLVTASQINSFLPLGTYKLSGCTGGSTTTYDLRFFHPGDNSTVLNHNGDTQFTRDAIKTDSNISILVRSGQVMDNVVIKPMIRDAAIEDNTYVPYAPTNRELYEMILALQ